MSRKNVLTLLSVALLAGLPWWIFGPSRPPQIGSDPHVFSAVDALFTA